jgi:hypothetical protein
MSPTGHLAIGFISKGKLKTRIPLIWLLIGSYLIDLVYLGLTLLGIESFGNDPYSHSLVMALVYTLCAGLLTWALMKNKAEGVLMGAVVLSHWVLDFIVWDNLPVAFGKTPLVGLGLYARIGFDFNAIQFNSGMMIATAIELVMLLIGILLYRKRRQPWGKKELQNG